MIKTIIIEDEINVREVLKKMLKILAPNIEVIAETGYVGDAVHLINTHKPKLVFMDVELEDGTGFDVLKQLKSSNFKLIFTTAYNQYAINAFKFSAIDYLLKPIDPTDLKESIDRAVSGIDADKEHEDLLKILNNNLEKEEQKIVLKTTEQRHIIKVKDIIRLEADGAYTVFICTDLELIISKNIKYYQDLLDDTFIRCHQSHLVNSKHVIGIDKNDKLIMSNSDLVVISTRKKKEIINLITKG